MEIFEVSKYISVPLAGLAVRLLVIRDDYRSVEKVFLVASGLYLCYVASGLLARPRWEEVLHALVRPSFRLESGFMTMAITIVGTTIAPWMQFYQQSAIADKGLRPADYRYERRDVIVGSLFAVFVAAFTISCAATIYGRSHIETAQDAARALGPLAGPYASTLFAFGLPNASLFSAAILPLSTAYVVCEAFGWESGLGHRWKETPISFGTCTALIVLGAGVVLLPIPSLVQAMMFSQTLNGILLPLVLVVMLRPVNDRRLMGRFVNGRALNAFSWTSAGLVILLPALLVLSPFLPTPGP